ncbi:8105_t:CDS:1, partial [Cetraspora pellucida]
RKKNTNMSQFTSQIINVQLQNNNGQLQRPQNVGGLHNVNGQLQRASNIGWQHTRLQNNTNLLSGAFIAIQYYEDLVRDTDLFTRTQGIEIPPPQGTQSLTLLISGLSFP